ncbi:MAG: ribosome-binding factor A [Deltaproteobacteria bacterium CG_4_8_14_3_um_filter_45_9]|nr:MAG: ribosome-binding factor A [Deltaproteobacteria bacterium CG03_land_8_20_14_0_80_45_14]PIX23313.1 MAG: ribosome-binding factor A [Deltaproteobacteria bacterium CG_4_8_14_3_um_filter_45_9]
MEGKRSEKVADLIRKEISQMLVKSIKDPRIGFVTITKVTVSEDCRFAKVYFSVAGTPQERERSIKGLDSAKGFVRKELGRRIRLRYTPEILFQFDPSIEYAIHMEELIQSIHQEKEPNGDEEGN